MFKFGKKQNTNREVHYAVAKAKTPLETKREMIEIRLRKEFER